MLGIRVLNVWNSFSTFSWILDSDFRGLYRGFFWVHCKFVFLILLKFSGHVTGISGYFVALCSSFAFTSIGLFFGLMGLFELRC